MNKAKITAKFDDIELTDEEKRQCGIIKTAEGVIRVMPLSVAEKVRASFWRGIKTIKTELVDE